MRIYNFWNNESDRIVYGNDFTEYLLEPQRNLLAKDGNIVIGCTPTVSGANVNVSAGVVKSNQVTLSFLKNSSGAKVLPVAKVLASGVAIPLGSTVFVVVRILMSSVTPNLSYYDVVTSVEAVNSRATVFPSGNLIGEVLICKATNNNGSVSLDMSSSESLFATQQQVNNAISDRQISPDTLFGSYGYNNPVTITANHDTNASEHILQVTEPDVIITLNNFSDYPKARRNTVAKRIINFSSGSITIATSATGTLSLNSNVFSGGSFSAANIPTISGGILV